MSPEELAGRAFAGASSAVGPARQHDAARISGLRVLGFCDYFREPMSGGSEIVTLEVYKRLQALGAQTLVVSAVPRAPRGWEPVDGVDTRSFPMIDLSRLLRLQVGIAPGLLRHATGVAKESGATVLHGSSIHFQSTLAGARVARRLDLPFVTTAHLGSVEHLSRMARVATGAYERSIGRYILESSHRVIAVSTSVAEHLDKLGVPPTKVTVVENGVDIEHYRPEDRGNNPRRVVFVGRLIANKGPIEALEAFARAGIPGWRLVFAGDGPLAAVLEDRARELGVDERVDFLGLVPDVAPILNTSDILIRPSLTEGRALAVLEAMAAGMCVVISDIAPNREMVEHGKTGFLVELGDADAWASTLARVASDRGARTAVGSAARAAVSPASWENVAWQTGLVLAGVTDERGVS